MGLIDREVRRAIDDEKRARAAERRANEADAARTEQPNDRPEGER